MPTTREDELRALLIMASHDLKSPLAALSVHLEILREDHGDKLDLSGMERALRRVTRLAEDMLSYATAEQTDLAAAPAELGDLVADVILDHGPGAATGPVTVAGVLPAVRADARLLRHVLDNLIGNAIKYTPSGSAARVTVAAHQLPGGTVRVEVADRGIGLPAADRDRAFDAFHRCANSDGYPGTGLGLAICRRIVERHGGRIGVDENPGGGSRFWFTLPAERAGSEEPTLVTRPRRAAPPLDPPRRKPAVSASLGLAATATR
ncbi:sensor histidine kinase [Paractinoplanes rishiriensis]|uniref:histidine kinase n=1 Tax=Paractinoplanes rishiriensis TaxID=1050105 RepID=A0A919K199_9ACTN|nr:HAMP domain-containing sensor histidine kinase [Actinoplanes rishiriensis]GIE97210.1 hypothetical protein Ari01nite_46750 [Actinoplanes rishiriensis]